MGPRSLTVFKDDEAEIAVLYRQMDGYPEGHGADLAEIIGPMSLCNGTSLGDQTRPLANGMACLAAQVIAKLKTGIGGFYLHPAGTRDIWEEYIYTVYSGEPDAMGNADVRVQVTDVNMKKALFDDTAAAFAKWIAVRVKKHLKKHPV